MVYRLAYKHSDEVVFYFDAEGNKYVASGGSLAGRINNPGLVRSHSVFSRKNGSIGACGIYAIFSNPQQGRKALSEWLHSKKYYHSTYRAYKFLPLYNICDKFFSQTQFLLREFHEKTFETLRFDYDVDLRSDATSFCTCRALSNYQFGS